MKTASMTPPTPICKPSPSLTGEPHLIPGPNGTLVCDVSLDLLQFACLLETERRKHEAECHKPGGDWHWTKNVTHIRNLAEHASDLFDAVKDGKPIDALAARVGLDTFYLWDKNREREAEE